MTSYVVGFYVKKLKKQIKAYCVIFQKSQSIYSQTCLKWPSKAALKYEPRKTGGPKIQVYLIRNILWREWSHKTGGPEIQVYLTWNILWREIKIKVT